MTYTVGIGIVTFNRREILRETIQLVRAFTRERDAALVVADDGSDDGTADMLRQDRVPVINGINMGVAWNKNRALFLLSHILGCETVILLEDDTQPNRAGWEAEWIQAAQRWGHVNYAADWIKEHFVSGSGTADDPLLSAMVTAQCSAYSSTALTYAGYFDSHFKGYGHGHVEHTRRLIRVGYGGSDEDDNVLYRLINNGLTVVSSMSHFDSLQEKRNFRVATRLLSRQGYRAPWGNDVQLRQFRLEIETAMRAGPGHFRLLPETPLMTGQQPRPQVEVSRLFRQA